MAAKTERSPRKRPLPSPGDRVPLLYNSWFEQLMPQSREHTLSTQAIVENPEAVTSADIVVGIPSLNEADSIAGPTEAAGRGLSEFFPDLSSVIINVDNNSTDGTKEAFFGAPTRVPKIYISTPEGVRGKGNNFHNLFRAAVELGAKSIVVVDADLETITPSWIRYLGEPVLDGMDYVSPIYVRHKYDGTITNHIAYPLVRSLFGLRVRQPIGGDFGFSGKLARAWLSEHTWSDNVGRFGIDIWMTTVAITRNFKVCQAFLGTPKGHRVKDPAADLTPMFTQVVSTLFRLVVEFEYHWKDVTKSRPSSVFGFGLGAGDQVAPVNVSLDPLFKSFRAGAETHWSLWEKVLSAPVLRQVEALGKIEDAASFGYDTPWWARILFDYIVATRNETAPADELIESLVPFYHSRVLSFVNRTLEMDTREAEEYLENITRTFQQEKSYLIERWDRTSARRRQRLF